MVGVLSALGEAVDGDKSENEGREPDDHGQERESLSGAPLATGVGAAQRESNPVPGATTASSVEPRDEETEDGSPTGSED